MKINFFKKPLPCQDEKQKINEAYEKCRKVINSTTSIIHIFPASRMIILFEKRYMGENMEIVWPLREKLWDLYFHKFNELKKN